MNARIRRSLIALAGLCVLAVLPVANSAAAGAPGRITLLAATCNASSSMYTRVVAGQDPTSTENGTPAAPSDIAAYGCTPANSINWFMIANSTANSAFLDEAMTQPMTISNSEAGPSGGATVVPSGTTLYVPGGVAQARRLSMANFPTTIVTRSAMPVLDIQCLTDGVNSDNSDGAGWGDQAIASGAQAYCIGYTWDGSELATPTPSPSPTNTPTPTATATPSTTPAGSDAGATATLTVNFPGLSDTHVYAHSADNAAGAVSGGAVGSSTWKSNTATLTLPKGTYDVRIVHGPVTTVIDGVSCSADCTATVPLATLTTNFPGMSDVHTYAHVSDGAEGTYGAQDSGGTWKTDSSSLVLLRGVYDVRVVHGPGQLVLDAVDCRAATCSASVPLATLTVNFPGLSDAHAYVHLTDGAAGTYGAQDSSSTWKENSTSLVLLQAIYDVRVVHGPTNVVIDDVNCKAATCTANIPMANLTVNFPGLSDAHSYVHASDGKPGTYGSQDSSSTWKANSTNFTLLRAVYDVRVVHGPTAVVLDSIDCTSGTCSATAPLAKLTVNFPGMTDTHTYVHATDGSAGTFGAQDSSSTWKSGSASFTLLQAKYDVRVVHGPVALVLDDIDCRAETCSATAPTATLTVTFPGLTDAHTYVHATDNAAGTYGAQDSSSTWRSNNASFTLLQAVYDVRVVQGPGNTVLDGIDCRAATCSVDVPLAKLTVEFKGHSNVHSYVRLDDGAAGSAGGAAVRESTWQTNSTSFVLLRRYYDVLIREGKTDLIVDAVDCTGATCSASLAQAAPPSRAPKVTKTFVSESGDYIAWRLQPSTPGKFSVWDSEAVKCEAFGGADCGGIGSGGAGTFSGEADESIVVYQPFKKDGDSCEVTNTAEYSLGDGTTKPMTVSATYKCSGASTMGWGLFALFATGAASLAWVVQRKLVWSR